MDDTPIRPGRFWWIAIVRGILSVLLGTAVLITEGNRAMIVNAVGVYWLMVGLLTIRWAITVRWRRGTQIGLLAGSVSVIAALLVLFREQLQDTVSANTLIDVVGAAAVFTGVLRVLGAFEVERTDRAALDVRRPRPRFHGSDPRCHPLLRRSRGCARDHDRARSLGVGRRSSASDRRNTPSAGLADRGP